MKKILVVVAVLIFNVGCFKAPTIRVQQIPTTKKAISKTVAQEAVVTQRYNLLPFKSLSLDGNTTVELINGPYAADVTGTEKDLCNYSFTITNQVLHIATPASANKFAIKLFAPGLESITVEGNATVSAKNFKNAGLIVTTKNHGSVNLEGRYTINKIYQRGNGEINIGWVDSDNLFVDSRSGGSVCLAGKVSSMVAKLTHNAKFDARYLRVQRASVFATDRARADIVVLNTLGGYAVDSANIFYYKKPRNLTVVTRDSGNVLQLGWIH